MNRSGVRFPARAPHEDRRLRTASELIRCLDVGPAGAGQLTKTINNVLYDINIAALAEVVRSGNLSRGSWTAASEVTTRPVEADGSWGSTLS